MIDTNPPPSPLDVSSGGGSTNNLHVVPSMPTYTMTGSGSTQSTSTSMAALHKLGPWAMYFMAIPTEYLIQVSAALSAGAFLCVLVLPAFMSILVTVMVCCCLGTAFSIYLAKSVLICDDGTEEMRAVSDPIREGAGVYVCGYVDVGV